MRNIRRLLALVALFYAATSGKKEINTPIHEKQGATIHRSVSLKDQTVVFK